MDAINLDILQRRLEAMQQVLRDLRALDLQKKGWVAFDPALGGPRIKEKEQQVNKLLQWYNNTLQELSIPLCPQFHYEQNPMCHDARSDRG